MFHASFSHVHKLLLEATVLSMRVKLTGTLQPCEGCEVAKAIRAPIANQTSTRFDRK